MGHAQNLINRFGVGSLQDSRKVEVDLAGLAALYPAAAMFWFDWRKDGVSLARVNVNLKAAVPVDTSSHERSLTPNGSSTHVPAGGADGLGAHQFNNGENDYYTFEDPVVLQDFSFMSRASRFANGVRNFLFASSYGGTGPGQSIHYSVRADNNAALLVDYGDAPGGYSIQTAGFTSLAHTAHIISVHHEKFGRMFFGGEYQGKTAHGVAFDFGPADQSEYTIGTFAGSDPWDGEIESLVFFDSKLTPAQIRAWSEGRQSGVLHNTFMQEYGSTGTYSCHIRAYNASGIPLGEAVSDDWIQGTDALGAVLPVSIVAPPLTIAQQGVGVEVTTLSAALSAATRVAYDWRIDGVSVARTNLPGYANETGTITDLSTYGEDAAGSGLTWNSAGYWTLDGTGAAGINLVATWDEIKTNFTAVCFAQHTNIAKPQFSTIIGAVASFAPQVTKFAATDEFRLDGGEHDSTTENAGLLQSIAVRGSADPTDSVDMWIGGSEVFANTAATGWDTWQNIRFGGNGAALESWEGRMGEILVYGRQLSDNSMALLSTQDYDKIHADEVSPTQVVTVRAVGYDAAGNVVADETSNSISYT